ncbi:hypothetical protein [Pseudomonas sp. MH10]|uniref:hypothetical protein n=1 Tax=Pseudomonas sp. MH10 TaxID=3048627 RepID=UPI002AC8F950|nr:hypothetical protein [Pseudomonas sp. MH10]MEB0040428.1 hypothetical protein [Pseudomonas sp. MH10]WPX61839.1 hypothetical protein RHM59_12800 [Pseudomonas sp. MH10]
MFTYIFKRLEEAEWLLIDLGASGSDLNAKIESIQHVLKPETANALIKVGHAINLPPEFFSQTDIEDLEALLGEAVSALKEQAFEKSSEELREQLKDTLDFPEPSMLERIKNFFAVDLVAQSRKMEPSKLILINLLKRQSLSCNKCNNLSVPILDTADHYKCIKCARQFISTRHYIRTVILDSFKDSWTTQRLILKYYDECVERIIDQA